MKIGFFLHTPFPSSEVYRVLPLRKHLLSGILASDLVGFHTLDYARHFMTAASRLLRLTRTTHGLLLDDGRIVDVRAFPIGIDPIPFQLAVTSDSVMQRVSSIRASVILKPLSVREKVDPNGGIFNFGPLFDSIIL